MRRFFTKKISLLFLILAVAAAGLSASNVFQSNWVDTETTIDLTHIFEGEINSHGKPVGFHVVPKHPTATSSRIKEILSGPNKTGVYTAMVEIYDPGEKKWKEKFSSIFPDSLSKQQVIDAILTAAANNRLSTGAKWRGLSGHGFLIEGYRTRTGAITTAYPLYIAD